MFLKGCFSGAMGWVEALAMSEVRLAKRCWVYIGGVEDYEEEVLVVKVGDMYVVGTVLDNWYVVPDAVLRRFLAKLLNVEEEDVSLKC
jgi:hypothetical protein